MIKLIGIICLITGFGGLALEKVQEKKRLLKRLLELKLFITYMLKEIEHSHIPIPYICREYVQRCEGDLKRFLERVCGQFEKNEGKSFDVLWETELSKIDVTYTGDREIKRLLQELGNNFGFCNAGMQLSALEQYRGEIEKIILHKEKKFQDDRKLILYFGVMSGLLLSIILL